jgi:cell division protein FtsA
MFERTNIIAGLEIGTSKICVVVAEQNAGGGLNVIGVGQSLSRGVRKGEIINPQDAEQDVRDAVSEAEQMADVEIRSVYVGVTGNHIGSFNSRGFHRVYNADYEITQEDVEDVLNNARAVNLPMENSTLHSMRQHFLVDGEDGVTDPVGMHGSKLEVDVHTIHGRTTRLQNVIRLVRATSLQVEDVVFTGLATALALLTPEQKELGCLVIDMGGGTTEYVVYSRGIIRDSGVLTIGGDHLSNDLAIGLKISLHRAEKLKREHGSAVVTDAARDQTASVTDERGWEVKKVKVEQVQLIMSLRIEELFRVIAEELEREGMIHWLNGGVLLCGGCVRVPHILTVAEKVFQMPATFGHANAVSGLASTLDEPEFATAIGLVKYGALHQSKPVARVSWWARLKEFIKRLVALVG